MSRMMEDLRSLRNAVVSMKRQTSQEVEPEFVSEWDRSLSEGKITFKKWKKAVSGEVEDICGMGIEILEGVPWREMYGKGMSPRRAAEEALQAAEDEDMDDEDEILFGGLLGEEEDSRDIEEGLLGKRTYPKWAKKLNAFLKKTSGTTLEAIKKASPVNNAMIHSLFMSQVTIEMAARLIMQAAGVAAEDVSVNSSSLRRRRMLPEMDDLSDDFDILDELSELEAALDDDFNDEVEEALGEVAGSIGASLPKIEEEAPVPAAKAPRRGGVYDRLAAMVEDMALNPPPEPKGPFAGMPGSGAKMDPVQEGDALAGVADSMRAIAEQESQDKKAFMESQKRKQEEDERQRDRMKKRREEDEGDEDDGVVEASVQGGDFGRWGPATSAAGAAGRGIAAALSKGSETKYTFHPEGTAQSSSVGSDLWFEIEPSDSKENIYYLGFKIKGDKENPTWDVMLKKGKGLGSSSIVSSQKGLQTSELKGGAKKLSSGIGKTKE